MIIEGPSYIASPAYFFVLGLRVALLGKLVDQDGHLGVLNLNVERGDLTGEDVESHVFFLPLGLVRCARHPPLPKVRTRWCCEGIDIVSARARIKPRALNFSCVYSQKLG